MVTLLVECLVFAGVVAGLVVWTSFWIRSRGYEGRFKEDAATRGRILTMPGREPPRKQEPKPRVTVIH